MVILLDLTDAFHLTQTSVAILAILGLFAMSVILMHWTRYVNNYLFRVIMHHRRDAQLLTQSQEEMVLISSFALFWIGE